MTVKAGCGATGQRGDEAINYLHGVAIAAENHGGLMRAKSGSAIGKFTLFI